MAVYQLKVEDTWLPMFARGKGLTCAKIRVHSKDGTIVEITLNGLKQTSNITDARCIRHLDNDPRFIKIV